MLIKNVYMIYLIEIILIILEPGETLKPDYRIPLPT